MKKKWDFLKINLKNRKQWKTIVRIGNNSILVKNPLRKLFLILKKKSNLNKNNR